MIIKDYNRFLNEELPFDSYPGPPLIAKPADYINYLYPGDDELDDDDEDTIHGYGFSFPYYKNGPWITRWSGDNQGQIGINGGNQGGRIGGEFDIDFSPGGSIDRKIPENDPTEKIIDTPKIDPKKQRILNFLQQLDKNNI